jgi:uncharacterized protein YndB with AHSA1/START domain
VTTQTIEPIRIATTVDVPPARAWEAFTQEITRWWPLEKHSMFVEEEGRRAEAVVLEGRVGGELYERLGEDRYHWATVLVWEPPHRVTVEWRVNPDGPPTEWTATFTPEGEGTWVEIVHTGWEAYADRAAEMRQSYGSDEGWGTVFGAFERFLNGSFRSPR